MGWNGVRGEPVFEGRPVCGPPRSDQSWDRRSIHQSPRREITNPSTIDSTIAMTTATIVGTGIQRAVSQPKPTE